MPSGKDQDNSREEEEISTRDHENRVTDRGKSPPGGVRKMKKIKGVTRSLSGVGESVGKKREGGVLE